MPRRRQGSSPWPRPCPPLTQEFMEIKNCVRACNKEGLLKMLETQQAELELCEKVGRAGGRG